MRNFFTKKVRRVTSYLAINSKSKNNFPNLLKTVLEVPDVIAAKGAF